MTRLSRQRGVAMVLLLAMISMGTTWLVVSRLNAASNDWLTAKRAHNTRVLAQAKQALIGYVAAQANKAGEDNPGALPCPEDPGSFDSAHSQGKVGSGCGSSLKVGRFPWRTLGLDRLVDADGEPLWYVVSTNWGPGAVINSNTTAGLTVDGVANAAIAIIIAPGASLNVSASSGCTAWSQVRATTGTPDWRNYLECENATSPADLAFVTTGPSDAFNDQVLTLKAAEIMPAIEASIANRIEREIVPLLNSVYTASGPWGITGSNPIYPFPATFSDPDTATYRGASANTRGLLPVNYVTCTEGSDPRCANSTFLGYSKAASDVQTGGGGYIRTQSSCSWQSSTYVCTGEYFNPTISVQVTVNVTNVAGGLRTLDTSTITCTAVDDAGGGIPQQTVTPCTKTVSMQPNGSLNIVVSMGTLPDISASGWGTYATYSVRVPRAIFGDHDLLSTSTSVDTGWFVRNGWHKLTYYAVAGGYTAAALPSDRSCTTGTSCLTISSGDPARPITANAARAVLVLGGRSINGSARPSSALTDYLEYGNATGRYERQTISPLSMTTAYADTGTANAYQISATNIATDRPFYIRAANENSGASTLVVLPSVVPLPLVNFDGSPLAAGQIPANGVIEVVYNGSRFVLRRSPFNDRLVVVSSN